MEQWFTLSKRRVPHLWKSNCQGKSYTELGTEKVFLCVRRNRNSSLYIYSLYERLNKRLRSFRNWACSFTYFVIYWYWKMQHVSLECAVGLMVRYDWKVEGLKRFWMVLAGWVMIWNFLRVLPWVETHGTCRHTVPNLFIYVWSENFQGFQVMPLKEIYGECYWLPWGNFIKSSSGSAWNHALVIFMAYLLGMWVTYTYIQSWAHYVQVVFYSFVVVLWYWDIED